MESARMCLTIILFLFGVSVVFCYEDSHEMKQMLEKLVEQNKKLEEKFATITAGLTDMCRAVNLATCDCQDMDNSGSGKVTMKSNDDIRLMSLESQGEMNDSVRLTIKFEASEGYGFEWFQMIKRGNAVARSPGAVVKTKLLDDRYLYTSDFQVNDYRITRTLFFRIYSLKNIASIELNMRAIGEKGESQFNDTKYKITSYSPSIVLPDDIMDAFNITIDMDRSIRELEEKRNPGSNYSPDYYYTFVNSTTDGYEVKEITGGRDMTFTPKDNGIGDIELTITLLAEYLENGGLFSFSLPQMVTSENQFVQNIWSGVVIELLRSGRQSIVPQGTVAVFNQNENIYVASTTVSIFCFAMGNPAPNVTISKVRKSGTKELKSEVIIDDEHTVLRSVTLHDTKKKGKSLTGTYTCTASNGIETKTTNTVVHPYREIVFDDRKTGLKVNTTSKVTVSCKASGYPRPNIELRLGDNYGPNLLKAKGNFTSKVSSKGDTTKAVITFAPVDDRFDVVYCVANQDTSQFYDLVEREIRIFQDKSETDWYYDKYSFYEQFRPDYPY